MKRIIYILFLFLGIVSNVNSQINIDSCCVKYDVFGKPRTPLESSFYTESMQIYDEIQNLAEIINIDNIYELDNILSLLEIVSRLHTSGKTIVYDASIPEESLIIAEKINPDGTEGVTLKDNYVFIEKNGKVFQIPISFEEKIPIPKDIRGYIYNGLIDFTPSNIKGIQVDGIFKLFEFKSPESNKPAIIIEKVDSRTSHIWKINNSLYLAFLLNQN
ncbi:MAG: hypothetical protein FWC41_02250 [Firmicutes bacterium]|nr:hypothetical protein [Bacillota bacterium]